VSFITVNLAQGKNEAWITHRTGHRSSPPARLHRATHTALQGRVDVTKQILKATGY
jgi:hypothetical protein